MTRINHTVEQLTTADTYTAFNGLNTISLTVTVPAWHEPFPIQVRMGAANPRKLEMNGLLHVCKTWYLNGPVADQWTISTLNGPIQVPAGTLIETEELPEKWEALTREASKGKQEWFAYSNGRTAFCQALLPRGLKAPPSFILPSLLSKPCKTSSTSSQFQLKVKAVLVKS